MGEADVIRRAVDAGGPAVSRSIEEARILDTKSDILKLERISVDVFN